MKHIFIALVKFYRKFLSPLKAPCCRFTPTCSEYSVEAFAERGAIVGLFLTVWRILRCNPFCKGGYDPVPSKGERRKKHAVATKDTLFLSDKANGRK
jgi:putative membrane protein insertion efficiency factor